jgi:hypothetical protein
MRDDAERLADVLERLRHAVRALESYRSQVRELVGQARGILGRRAPKGTRKRAAKRPA